MKQSFAPLRHRYIKGRWWSLLAYEKKMLSEQFKTNYGTRTIVEVQDLPTASSRCRSSIVCSLDADPMLLTPPRSTKKCRHVFDTSLSSTSSSLAVLIQKKVADPAFREQHFAKLSRHHRLLLVLNDYQCSCGCHFSVRQGSFVLLDETKAVSSSNSNEHRLVAVISNQLICSKVPAYFLCDVQSIWARVRLRPSQADVQSFDL